MSILIGIVVGLLLGLTGAGGAILAVPLLMAGLDWPMTQAATTALLAVSIAATVGTAMAWRHSYVRYRAALLLGVVGVLFSPLGIYLANTLHPLHLQLIFAGVLMLVALRMLLMTLAPKDEVAVLRSSVAGEGLPSPGRIGRINPATGRLIWSRPVAITVGVIGAVTGFLSGLLGVGGGFVIVPALRATLPLSMHSAVATSLMAIAITSFGAFVNGLLQGREAPWVVALPFVAGAVLGMMIGRQVSPYLSGRHLQQFFAGIAMIVAGMLVVHAT